MSVARAIDLFEEATEAARDGRCQLARNTYRKGVSSLRQVLRKTPSYRAVKMLDAQSLAKAWLRRGCAYLAGRR